MEPGKVFANDLDLKGVLKKYRTAAIVEVSLKPNRNPHKVARFLKEKGHERLIR